MEMIFKLSLGFIIPAFSKKELLILEGNFNTSKISY